MSALILTTGATAFRGGAAVAGGLAGCFFDTGQRIVDHQHPQNGNFSDRVGKKPRTRTSWALKGREDPKTPYRI